MNRWRPWVSMWFHPQETVEALVMTRPRYGFWPLSFCYGWLLTLFREGPFVFTSWPIFLFSTFVLAPLLGVLFFGIMSFLLLMVGKILNGKASFSAMLTAVSWSHISSIPLVLLYLGFLFALHYLFSCIECEKITLNQLDMWFFFGFAILQSLLGIWTVILLVASIAKVQKFSLIRSILSFFLLAFVVVMLGSMFFIY